VGLCEIIVSYTGGCGTEAAILLTEFEKALKPT